MAQHHFRANVASWDDALAAGASDAEPALKNGTPPADERAVERSISEPASLIIVRPAYAGNSRPREKHQAGPTKNVANYRAFRCICDDIAQELSRADTFLQGDEMREEGAEIVAEVEVLLEDLYGCPYGQGECLKRVVVALQSQVGNARWDRRLVDFLKEVFGFLRVRYLIDETTVAACFDMMETHGLNPFRGTIREPRVAKKYRIQEVMERDESTGTPH